MAKVKMRSHMRKVEVVAGRAADAVPRANVLRMLVEEGRLRIERVPWYVRKWRSVVRFFAVVWGCVWGRASARAVAPALLTPRQIRRRRRKRRRLASNRAIYRANMARFL